MDMGTNEQGVKGNSKELGQQEYIPKGWERVEEVYGILKPQFSLHVPLLF